MTDPTLATDQHPHRLRRALLWAAGLLLGLPLALVALILIAANTAPGRAFIASRATSLSGGLVTLQGLSGRIPDRLRIAHLELHDGQGTWLTLDGAALDWSPLALLTGTARIASLAATQITVARAPVATPPAKPAPPSTKPFSLPVAIDLQSLQIAQLTLGPALAGHPATLAVAGRAHATALDQATAHLTLTRQDAPGTYTLAATLTPQSITAALDAAEPPGGLAASLASLPSLGRLTLHATLAGPRTAEATTLALAAGPLQATATGTIDLPASAATLAIDATAPAMAPRPDVAWDSIALHATTTGPFTAPSVTAHAELHNLRAAGATIPTLVASATGNRGTVDATATLTGLLLPPPEPTLFAAAPLTLHLHALLNGPTRPVTFALTHPLITADGTATTAGDLTARLHTTIPSLAPFAAIGHTDIQGATEAVATLARHNQASDVTVDGTANFTGGLAPLPTLLGRTTYGATAHLDGQNFTISRAIIDGAQAHADVTGTDFAGTLALAWNVTLRNLAALSPQARGALAASGRLSGAPGGLAVQADLHGEAGTATLKPGPITASIRAQGLPNTPSGTITATGRLEGAPLQLAATLDRQPDGTLHATLSHADWRSLAATANLTLAHGQTFPTGTIAARIPRLADFAALAGQPLAGSLDATIQATQPAGRPAATIALQAANLTLGANSLARAALTGTVADALANPTVALTLAADGIAAGRVTGHARLTANGPQSALALRTQASLLVANQPATLTAAAVLDAKTHALTLATLTADYRAEALRLRAPTRLTYGAATAIDGLHLTLGPPGTAPATLDVAGRIAPTLALTAALHNVTPELARPFAPNLHARGTIAAEARLSGTTAAPLGTIRVTARDLHSTTSPLSALLPGNATLAINLAGTTARLAAQVDAGSKLTLAANGTAPLQAGGPLAIHATGTTDLSLLNPILGASGQRAAGTVAFDTTVAGTTAAPRLAGSLTLNRGELQDFAQGLHLTAIAAHLTAANDTLRIDSLTAQAGPGTLAAHGTVGILAPTIPVDLTLTARNARPLASDLLTATLDANLTLTGAARTALEAAGHILVRQADINIPNSLPPSVATLHVRRPGDRPPPATPTAPAAIVRLALTLDAPRAIFIRGHGLDSELGGKLTIGGTTAAPAISGGFEMRRGTISIAGTTLNFTHGEVGFDGTSVTNRIDPTLNFVADSTSGSVTATLTVGGYADAPTIKLSSTPDLPQDEVLAHLLFGTSVKDLSAIQIAEIAAALAELSGVTGGGADPLAAVRKGLGLDRLSVGGGSGSGSGATIEAGRYVARGVFIGAKQATSGGGTAAEVQIDLTRHLKARAQLATGGGSTQGATPDNDQGSTIGLSYQFDY